ncbi:MAG: DNA-binding protein [Candidatus Hadarchaeales archaeon]
MTWECKPGKSIVARLPYGEDIIKSITSVVREKKISLAHFTVVGALKRAKIAYYDQGAKEYKVIEIQSPHEIVSCTGNISVYKGEPFVHAHVVLADHQGFTRGGHLLEGTIFAAELHLQELEGPRLERSPDKTTGLVLWREERSL